MLGSSVVASVPSPSGPALDDTPPLRTDVLFHLMGLALWGTLAGFAVLLVA